MLSDLSPLIIVNRNCRNIEEAEWITNEYKERYENLAKWTLEKMQTCSVHQEYLYPKEEGTWYIPTKIYTFPLMVKELCRLYPDKVFNRGLDAGCGTTSFFEFYPIKEQILCDISLSYCEYMKKKGFVNTVEMDVMDMGIFPDEHFDIIICSDILEHVLSFKQVESEINRLLKKNGVLCVNVPWNQKLNKQNLSEYSHLRDFGNHNVSVLFHGWNIKSCCEIDDGDRFGWIRTCNIIMEKNNG